jgi:hypothetical protein
LVYMAKYSGVTARLSAFTRKPFAACALMTGLAVSAFWANVELPAGAAEFDSNANYSELAAAEPWFSGSIAQRTGSVSRTEGRTPLSTEAATLPDVPAVIAAENLAEVVTVDGAPAGYRMEVRTETDPFERVERQDANRFSDLPPLVVQRGRDGEVTRVYRYLDDAVDAIGTAVLEIVASARQDEIVAIGTRERPAVASGGGFEGGLVTGDIPESVWVALAQCESGGRPSVISAGGRFHGLYQFSVATWNSVGGTGLPSNASPEEQRYRAVRLQARSGWGQWPSCSRRIGVR